MKLYLLLLLALATSAHAQPSSTLAYTRTPEGAPPWPVQDICLIRANKANDHCLTTDGHSHHPSWSPHSKKLLFIHDSPLAHAPAYKETDETRTHHPIELSIMDADGRNRHVLRVIEPVIYSTAWSPDGKTLAISAATAQKPGEAAQTGLYLLSADGKGDLHLFRQNAWTPSWSPDSRKLAYTVEHPRGHWRMYTANTDGTNETAIGHAEKINGAPAWSPDGRAIAFDQFIGANDQQQVFVMNPNGANVHQITADPAWSCAQPSWSPDGTQLAVSCRSISQPCGLGLYSTGQKMPECTRRIFLIPATTTHTTLPPSLAEHDAASASFSPAAGYAVAQEPHSGQIKSSLAPRFNPTTDYSTAATETEQNFHRWSKASTHAP